MDILFTILEVAAKLLGLWFVAAVAVAVLFAVVLTFDRRLRHAEPKHRAGTHLRGRS